MSNISCKIDSKETDELLNKLDDDELKRKILFDGLKSGGKLLQEFTKSYFRQAMGPAAEHISRFINKPFVEGVKLITDKSYNEVIVSIMSDYRMRFYEKQIKQRKTKKGYNRGVVQAKHFFINARNSAESDMNDIIIESINRSFEKEIR